MMSMRRPRRGILRDFERVRASLRWNAFSHGYLTRDFSVFLRTRVVRVFIHTLRVFDTGVYRFPTGVFDTGVSLCLTGA